MTNVKNRRAAALRYLRSLGVGELVGGVRRGKTFDNRVRFSCGCSIVDAACRWKGRYRRSEPCRAHRAALGLIEGAA